MQGSHAVGLQGGLRMMACCVDADYAACVDTKGSVSRSVVLLAEAPTSYFSRTQRW